MNILKNKLQTIVVVLFLGFVAWWASFQHVVANLGPSVQRFGYTYGILALIGSLIGFAASMKWGGYKTVLGKALFFLSLGLLAQEAGQLIFDYYIVVSKIDIPYPSWGDVAYFGSTLSYLCGGIYLAKAVGVRFSLKTGMSKFIAIIIPVILLSSSFWLFLHNHQYDWHHPLTVFLDIAYPLGDASYISMAIIAYLLSRKMLGGVMRSGILILILALFAQYVADWTFLYQSSRGTWVAGKFDDLFYLIAYFIGASAMIKFLGIYNELEKKTGTTKTEEAA